jgi:hypothetical protein
MQAVDAGMPFLLLLFGSLLLLSSAAVPVRAQCGVAVAIAASGADGGLDCSKGVLYTGAPTAGGLFLTTRATQATSPFAVAASTNGPSIPSYATGASLLYNLAVDTENREKSIFHADAGSTPPRVVRWTPGDESSASLVDIGASLTPLINVTGIAVDRRRRRLLVLDNTNPPRLLSIDMVTPSSSFEYVGVGAALGWEQHHCRSLCVDPAGEAYYVLCGTNVANTAARIFRVNVMRAPDGISGVGVQLHSGNVLYRWGQASEQ